MFLVVHTELQILTMRSSMPVKQKWKGVPTVIFFCHDRPRVGGPICSTPPSGHYNIFKKIGLHGFFVAQQ